MFSEHPKRVITFKKTSDGCPKTYKTSKNVVRLFFETEVKYQVTNARLTLLEERLLNERTLPEC